MALKGEPSIRVLVSDELSVIENAFYHAFPYSKHRSCWTHLSRTVQRRIKAKVHEKTQKELKEIYHMDITEEETNACLDAV